ncbi:MAG: flagellar basal body rod protein FlgC [Deltaproteobacteria bacterium]|nr:flagellar basal body rod protein FlgC [Deltaproteobacteria bacterium]MBW2018949.1 flagellar basal body rod protein FlgC [Deltaproteobacteria bacterium]MBW2073164.1 flagellar basal body rod protein FlgC [Deltaproteobacteria bacterium]RLB83784.1 MAG: flagellar basal body rod protein FlgC [Deltaproteobacteria bacterium]
MDLLTALHISTTGLTTQRMRMNIISTNLANMYTTRTQTGEAYRRKIVVMEAEPVEDFESTLRAQSELLYGVRVGDIVEDTTPFKRVYSPGHPDADESGYVSLPNVDVITEMADMLIARRSYEANVTAIGATKAMALKALEIGK